MERDRKGRLPWAIVLLILVFACGIAIAGALIYANLTNRSSHSSYQSVALTSAETVETVSDGFVYYDGSSVAKVNSDGSLAWSYMMGAGASVDASDAGVASWVGRTLTLIDGETGVPDYSGTMDANVVSARMGSTYAAVLLEPEDSGTIVLMETGGRQVDSIALSDQTVIDYGFFYNDSLFWAMVLDTDGTVPICTINVYRPGRSVVSSITDSEQMIYHAMFAGSSSIVCAGDTYVSVYSYQGLEEAESQKLVYGWTLVDADDEMGNPMMAFTLNGQYETGQKMQDVRMIRGDEDQIVRMPYGCDWLVALGNSVYGFSSDGIVMVAQMGRQTVDAYPLNFAIEDVYGVTRDGKAVVRSGESICLVPLG